MKREPSYSVHSVLDWVRNTRSGDDWPRRPTKGGTVRDNPHQDGEDAEDLSAEEENRRRRAQVDQIRADAADAIKPKPSDTACIGDGSEPTKLGFEVVEVRNHRPDPLLAGFLQKPF